MLVACSSALLVPGSMASAAPHTSNVHAAAVNVAATTCPTDPESSTGATIPCETTTTAPGTTTCSTTPVLQVTYADGTLAWKASGYPTSAAGTSVSLFVNGVSISTTTVVDSGGGCVPSTSAAGSTQTSPVTGAATVTVCLQPGTYSAVAVDSGFADTNSVSFTAPTGQTCANPTNLTGASPSAAKPGAGALAFTGANVARLGIIALCVIAIGAGLTKLARRRRYS